MYFADAITRIGQSFYLYNFIDGIIVMYLIPIQ